MLKILKKMLKNKNSRHWGLNPRPPHYKCDALPLSYGGYTINKKFYLYIIIINNNFKNF